jgi:hypothetical protein
VRGMREGDPLSASFTISLHPVAVTREQAAAMLGMGLTSFEQHVQPELRMIRKGKLRLVPVSELERWVEANAERILAPTNGQA